MTEPRPPARQHDARPTSADHRTSVEPVEPRVEQATKPARDGYATGVPEIDQAIAALIATAAVAEGDLLREAITAAVRIARDGADRGEMKLIARTLREFGRAFRLFAQYRDRPRVSIFGSARVQEHDPAYQTTARLARMLAERNWMVITGAGPGIMAAGNEGAGAEASFGAGIVLPGFEQANIFIANDAKLLTFRYFFTRKVTFVKESDAFVLLPGGFGTLDEAFELLTLMQTGKTAIRPVVLLEPPGSRYWRVWAEFVHDQLESRGFIASEDSAFYRIAATPEEAAAEIESFYANYRSMRFVGRTLYLRLQVAPTAEQLAQLRSDFGDLLASSEFEVVGPAPVEVADGDALDLARVAFEPVHNYARLRLLIDALNALG
ncbi:MAG TPA: TIGR00730 family Rossman fold protein [Dehalococcoidia bacterium]|nr:TIGR00730 family Rossman fold protein [Dehalococcoidia bacterium]